jgi:hypothetical protein
MAPEQRPFIAVYFRCCGVYQRVYRTPGVHKYVAFCPRCTRKIEVRVDPSGSDARFFEAY